MHHFWGLRQGRNLILNEEESRHARSVLRLSDGDLVRVLDGEGSAWEGALQFINKRDAMVGNALEIPNYGAVSGSFHLYVAPTKNLDRLEWLLEKSVEMGLHSLTLLECARSERRRLKLDRLVRVMQAACKQSNKGRLPLLHGPVPFEQALEACTSEQKAIAALIDGADSHFLPPLIRSKPTESWSVFIGPEGDFSESEVSAAQSKGFTLAHLGPHRLRTETAGLYAVAAFAQRLGV